MTEHHNIFQEIDADLEQQKYEELWKRFGPTIITVAVVAVLFAAGISWWHAYTTQQNQEATTALFKIVDDPMGEDTKKQIADLEKYSATSHGSYQILARLDAAALLIQTGDNKKAAEAYDAIANDSGVEDALRQFATLMFVRAQMDTGYPVQLEKRLDPLVTDDVPWHFTALEYQGFLALKAGDKDKALRIFTSLAQDARVPQTLGGLASDMQHYLSE